VLYCYIVIFIFKLLYHSINVNGPCLLDYLILELILPVVVYAASPLTLTHLSAKI